MGLHFDPWRIDLALERLHEIPAAVVREPLGGRRDGLWDLDRANHCTWTIRAWLRKVGRPLGLDDRVHRMIDLLKLVALGLETRTTYEMLSDELHLSSGHSSRLFREQAGLTLPEFRSYPTAVAPGCEVTGSSPNGIGTNPWDNQSASVLLHLTPDEPRYL